MIHPNWPEIDDYVVHLACLIVLIIALVRFVRDEIRRLFK
jgi:hypothetical protein